MAGYTQERRLLEVTTPLGKDVLLLSGFGGEEALSQLFLYQLDFLSENGALAPGDVVGKNIGWTVKGADRDPRYFHGVVTRFTAGSTEIRNMRLYRAEVVPWLWFLTRTADCRIFQNKTAPDIIEQIFKDLGFSDYEISLRGTYVSRDYCVQYRETDFNFVSRLMEQEGIFYYFRHEQGKHTLVLADQKTAYKDLPEKEVEYTTGVYVGGHLTRWEHQYEFRSGKWAQTDYNFETPSTSLMTNTNTVVQLTGNDKFEIYDYPGQYAKKGDGTGYTKVRMEEEEAPYNVVRGGGTCTTFTPGGKFTLKTHDWAGEMGQAYVVTSIQHSATEGGFSQGTEASQDYHNTFTCIPDSVGFRPPRTTRRPIVQGPQTAVVVGPSGEEIYTDKYGRVKVQFFWDRVGTKDEKSSCWIRVAENWAGKNWGIIFNPRIGQEVIVDFLEGDPDRPIITGRVYNAEQMPPYALPDNQTQSTIKSRSSKQGTTENYNELRFEDKKGSEEIYFHAEKDFNRIVENDDTLKVGSSDSKTCPDGSQTISIYKDRTTTIETGNETLTVKEGNRVVEITKGNETLTVKQGNREVDINTGNDTHHIKTGNREVNIDTGNDTLTVKTGNHSVQIKAGKSSTQAMQAIELVVGGNSIKIDVSGTVKITALQSIELAVGPSTVKIDNMGVSISGMIAKIDGQVQTKVSGLMTQVMGQVMLQAKGAITMIG